MILDLEPLSKARENLDQDGRASGFGGALWNKRIILEVSYVLRVRDEAPLLRRREGAAA